MCVLYYVSNMYMCVLYYVSNCIMCALYYVSNMYHVYIIIICKQ